MNLWIPTEPPAPVPPTYPDSPRPELPDPGWWQPTYELPEPRVGERPIHQA
jgi:hypothetical protein